METKTLNKIQTFAKVGKVLSKIVEICCIVGVIGCLVGIIAVSALDFDAFMIGGVTIHSMIENSAEISIDTIYAAMIGGLILCLGEAYLAKKASNYFKHELSAGTPFTFSGADEMKRLGISIIVISIGTMIAAQIVYVVICSRYVNVVDLKLEGSGQIGTGIIFLLVSLLCRYGAERENTGSQAPEEMI